MTQRHIFGGGDDGSLAQQTAPTPGLDWSRVNQGNPHPLRAFQPLEAIPPLNNPCELAPCDPSQVHPPADVARQEKPAPPAETPVLSNAKPNYLVNDGLYPYLRNLSYAGSFILNQEAVLRQPYSRLTNSGANC